MEEKKRILEPYGDIDLQMLKDITLSKGISGHDAGCSRVVKKYLEGHVDEIGYDNLGSIFGVQKGNGKGSQPAPKVAIFGHMDEIGFYVREIEDCGYLRVVPAGGHWTHVLLDQEVLVTTREGKEIYGVLGFVPAHGLAPEVAKTVKDLDELYIDIGVCDKQEAEDAGIRIGDMVSLKTDFVEMENPNYLCSKAWDDRVGVAIAVDVVRRLTSAEHYADVYAVGSTQEEVGLRGAKTAAYTVCPDIGIAIDSTYARDVPGAKYGTNLGSGVTLSVMDGSVIGNRELIYYMEDICKECGIDFVYDLFLRGGTDSGEIHKTGSGIVNMTLSIPSRYIHAHRAIIHRKDYADTVSLLVEFCKRVDWDLVNKFRASNR